MCDGASRPRLEACQTITTKKAAEEELTSIAQRLVEQVARRSDGYSGEGRNRTKAQVRDGLMDDHMSNPEVDRS